MGYNCLCDGKYMDGVPDGKKKVMLFWVTNMQIYRNQQEKAEVGTRGGIDEKKVNG